eukprot:TRINITY_DN11415_c0_g1_i1.p1 TRINITY_DN11415_c0_g1~~TRINITY_DN11415_c0_g1_i1.p1  ORF type:complete len:470 (+),score=115.78 TRINITY_DN11415_c0_g1_i1:38-1411(+)
MKSLLVLYLAFWTLIAAVELDEIPTNECLSKAPQYSMHDFGYLILVAAGSGVVFGFFAVLIVGILLLVIQPEWKVPVIGIALKALAIPCIVLAFVLLVVGVPMVVTGAYYSRWNKIYDVSGGCEELIQIAVNKDLINGTELHTTPEEMLIAYVGNSGAVYESLKVWNLIKEEGAEAVIHTGNFDFCDDSSLFSQHLDEVLGNITFIPVVGNNDLHVWEDYQEVLYDRFSTNEYLQCEGTLFVNYWCMYKGLFIAMSSVGTKCGDGYQDYGWHESELRSQLELAEEYEANWITCSWHKNQHNLQVGYFGDETGYGVYDICAEYGSLTVTSHDFAYARTHALSSFGDAEDDSVEPNITQKCSRDEDDCVYDVNAGNSVVVVSGLGGFYIDQELDEERVEDEIWGSTYVGQGGALFCKYNFEGISNLAYCYFKTVDEKIIDEFFITRGEAPVPEPEPIEI